MNISKLRLLLYPLLAVLALAAGLAGSPSQPASAAPATLPLPASSCSDPNSATVSFSWSAVTNATDVWLDLSLQDNGFTAGTFLAVGPLNPSSTSFTWNGILRDLPHVWRVNSLTASGWTTSETGSFVACGGPALLEGPITCKNELQARVHFRWAPMSPAGTQQWLDISTSDSFEPGAYQAVGPLPPERNHHELPFHIANVRTIFRVNELGADGIWRQTKVGNFTAACAREVDTSLQPSEDRLVIKNLGIDAPIATRNVGSDGFLGPPEIREHVIRYNFPVIQGLGGYPGDGGTTVLAGHVDFRSAPAVFWDLRLAAVGDIIEYQRFDGTVVTYAVDWVQTIPAGTEISAYLRASANDTMILLTCDGTFDTVARQYTHRYMAHAVRIN